MTISTVFAYDATGVNEPSLPVNVQAGGYDTGSSNIKWSDMQFARHTVPFPAYHYDQDASASDYLADLLDVETGAATDSEIVRWLDNSRVNYHNGERPGQRWPGIYCSENNVPGAVHVLQMAGRVNVPFVVANYSISAAEAQRRVSVATGPYPAVGYQFTDKGLGGKADENYISVPWLTTVSRKPPTGDPVQIPGINGQWLTFTWFYDSQTNVAYGIGNGTSGRLYMVKQKADGSWADPVLI